MSNHTWSRAFVTGVFLLLTHTAGRSYAQFTTPLPSAAPAAPVAQAPPVKVNMTANKPEVLLQQLGGSTNFVRNWVNRDGSIGSAVEQLNQWRPVCQAPCGVSVEPLLTYQIAGDGIKRSSRFLLPINAPEVTLHVKAGYSSRYGGGIALMVIGSSSVVAGLVVTSLARGRDVPIALGTGLPTLICGLGELAGGIVLYLFNRTSVTLEGGQRIARLGHGMSLGSNGLIF